MEHKKINKFHVESRYMGKTIYGQYLDNFCIIGMNVPVFVGRAVCFSISNTFRDTFSPPYMCRKRKKQGILKRISISHVKGLVKLL